jgi:hypothetical protein
MAKAASAPAVVPPWRKEGGIPCAAQRGVEHMAVGAGMFAEREAQKRRQFRGTGAVPLPAMLVQQWMWAAVLSPSRPPKAVDFQHMGSGVEAHRGRADGGGGVRRRFLCTGQDGGVSWQRPALPAWRQPAQ